MKRSLIQEAEKLLSSAELRITSPRTAILACLLDADRPISHQDISKKLGTKAPDKVTIYRALQSFVDAGFVHRSYLHKRTWHFEMACNCRPRQCHPHFICINCGRVHCMVQAALPVVKSPNKGFFITRQQIQLEGLCPDCNPNAQA